MISHVFLNLDGKGKVRELKWKIKRKKFCQNKHENLRLKATLKNRLLMEAAYRSEHRKCRIDLTTVQECDTTGVK
jgi:ABC-type transporter Mla MlaB component